MKIINKVFDKVDLNRPEYKEHLVNLENVRRILGRKQLNFSAHLSQHPLRLWEYCHTIIVTGIHKQQPCKILDVGGTGTIFSYYLATMGHDVYVLDIDEQKYKDAIVVAEALRINVVPVLGDMSNMIFNDEEFDWVYSISVIEHLSLEKQPFALKECARVLRKDGLFSLTFDFGPRGADNAIRIEEEIESRLINPSGLMVYGNKDFKITTEIGYRKPKTFAALFLKKENDDRFA